MATQQATPEPQGAKSERNGLNLALDAVPDPQAQGGGAVARGIQSFVWFLNSFKGSHFVLVDGERTGSRLPESPGVPAYSVGLSLGQRS